MTYNQEARKKFYEKELESGVFFEKNGELFMKEQATHERLQNLKDANFPENAVTVLGKSLNNKIQNKNKPRYSRFPEIWQPPDDVDTRCGWHHATREPDAKRQG